jgi:hypothetical protein
VRRNVLLAAALALLLAGSATATSAKPKVVRVVKRDRAITATLTYARTGTYTFADARVSIRRNGRLVLRRKVCPLDQSPHYGCAWARPAKLEFRRVDGRRPDAVVDLYTGGNHCCAETFIALLGRQPHWIAHVWGNWYSGRWIHGRYYFVSADGRFDCVLVSCAGSSLPIQIWAVSKAGAFANATRSLPSLVREDARRAWKYHRDPGELASWCADEYLLGGGSRCSHALDYALAHGYLKGGGVLYRDRAFIRQLNRDLERWGYKRG